MEKPTTEPISVEILDRQDQCACSPEEAISLKEAAVYLDDRMRSIKDAGRLMALERIAVMTALNLSDELLRLQKHEKHRKENLDTRIRMLADELDDALGE